MQAEEFASETQWSVSAIAITGVESVSISWPVSNGAFEASLTDEAAGSRRVQESKSNSVSYSKLTPGTQYQVALTSTDGQERYMQVDTFPSQQSVATERLISPLTYQPWYQSYIHKTFIPDYRVNVEAMWPDNPPGYTFGGDNRGFAFPLTSEPYATPNYRTMMYLHINWDNPAPYDLIWAKNVGQTRVYNTSGVLVNSAYADMSQMCFDNLSASSSYATGQLHHRASDPLCTLFGWAFAPPITYDETVQFWRSGTTSVSGSRFPAPAHEMYAKFTDVFNQDPSGRH